MGVGGLRGTCGGVRAILPLCGKDAVSPALLCVFQVKTSLKPPCWVWVGTPLREREGTSGWGSELPSGADLHDAAGSTW